MKVRGTEAIYQKIGRFDTPEDAARAYNKKARELGFLYVPPDPD